MEVHRCANNDDLVITNEDPNPRHPFRRIGPDHPRYAELLPLVQPGYVPPFLYAGNVFVGRPTDTSEEGLKRFAQEAADAIMRRVTELEDEQNKAGES